MLRIFFILIKGVEPVTTKSAQFFLRKKKKKSSKVKVWFYLYSLILVLPINTYFMIIRTFTYSLDELKETSFPEKTPFLTHFAHLPRYFL